MTGLIMAAQMILALTILVTIHEWGHYITGKKFGVRVEKFFVFFDAWGKKIFSFKRDGTEYGMGWLPLGGYVKLAGMIDESMDKDWEDIPKDEQFRFKPAWQKLIIMLAGIFMNIVLGIAIFTTMLLVYKRTLKSENVNPSNYVVSTFGESIGLQDGDQLIGANGEVATRYGDIQEQLLFGGKLNINRNGENMVLTVPENAYEQGLLQYPLSTLTVAGVLEGSNAELAGLQENDRIIGVNGQQMQAAEQVLEQIKSNPSSQITLLVKHFDNSQEELPVEVSEEGTIGIKTTKEVAQAVKDQYSKLPLGQALKYGVKDAFNIIALNIKGFQQIGKGNIKFKDSVAGPIQIATLFGATWNWERFWSLTGMLSMVLAFMNLLPIPALDGGHAVFAIIEMITGKPVSDKILETAQMIGFFLLMGLMIFIFGNDILKSFF